MSGAERMALVDPPEAPPVAEETPITVPESSTGGSAVHDRAIVNGVLWQGSLRWLSQVLSWSATIVIARRLSPSDYGMVGTATILVGLLSLVTEGGLGRSLVMRRERDEQLHREAHGASLMVGGVLAVIMLLAAYPLGVFYSEPRVMPFVAVLSLVMVFSGMNAIPVAIMQQRLEYRRLAVVEFSKAIGQASVVMIGALLGFGGWSLVAGLIAGHACAALLIWKWLRVSPARPTRAALGGTAQYAQQLVIAALAWYVYSSADFAVVGRVAGVTALGYYQFGWNTAQLPGEKLANVLQTVVGPFFGAIGDDIAQLRHYFLLLSEFLASVMLPVLTGFAVVAPVAVPLLFGAKWMPAVPVMQVLVLASGVASITLLSQHVLMARGCADIARRIAVTAAIAMPIAFYVAAKLSGPLAVACVWLIAQPILSAVPLLHIRREIGLSLRTYVMNLRAPTLSSAAMLIAVLGVQHLLARSPALVQLIAMIVTGAVTYPAVFLLCFRARVGAILAIWKRRG